jgi:hypothetical protein
MTDNTAYISHRRSRDQPHTINRGRALEDRRTSSQQSQVAVSLLRRSSRRSSLHRTFHLHRNVTGTAHSNRKDTSLSHELTWLHAVKVPSLFPPCDPDRCPLDLVAPTRSANTTTLRVLYRRSGLILCASGLDAWLRWLISVSSAAPGPSSCGVMVPLCLLTDIRHGCRWM